MLVFEGAFSCSAFIYSGGCPRKNERLAFCDRAWFISCISNRCSLVEVGSHVPNSCKLG